MQKEVTIKNHHRHARRAGEAASLEFVGYKHGNYYCQSRESASYYNCRYYNKCCGNYQLL